MSYNSAYSDPYNNPYNNRSYNTEKQSNMTNEDSNAGTVQPPTSDTRSGNATCNETRSSSGFRPHLLGISYKSQAQVTAGAAPRSGVSHNSANVMSQAMYVDPVALPAYVAPYMLQREHSLGNINVLEQSTTILRHALRYASGFSPFHDSQVGQYPTPSIYPGAGDGALFEDAGVDPALPNTAFPQQDPSSSTLDPSALPYIPATTSQAKLVHQQLMAQVDQHCAAPQQDTASVQYVPSLQPVRASRPFVGAYTSAFNTMQAAENVMLGPRQMLEIDGGDDWMDVERQQHAIAARFLDAIAFTPCGPPNDRDLSGPAKAWWVRWQNTADASLMRIFEDPKLGEAASYLLIVSDHSLESFHHLTSGLRPFSKRY